MNLINEDGQLKKAKERIKILSSYASVCQEWRSALHAHIFTYLLLKCESSLSSEALSKTISLTKLTFPKQPMTNGEYVQHLSIKLRSFSRKDYHMAKLLLENCTNTEHLSIRMSYKINYNKHLPDSIFRYGF